MTRSTDSPASPADPPAAWPPLEVDRLLDDTGRSIIVCCGSGGVGKTTTAAALGLRAAERGRKVVVLTIDPARRLAQAMGMGELDNTPRPVPGIDDSAGGRLDAMMLDMKRTFDEVVIAHVPAEQADQILANPFYQALSSSFAGTQEYMAMERLGQLYHEVVADPPGRDAGMGRDDVDSRPVSEEVDLRRYDLIVVDTPPSRSALDFLDAPKRLSSFLDSRLLRVLAAPTRGPLKLFSFGMSTLASILGKVLGAQVLRDVQTFVGSLDTTFGGFRERAERTYALLQRPGTAFVVVAAPDLDALREASYFIDRLRDDAMPLAGLVLNRQVTAAATGLSTERSRYAAEQLETELLATATGDEPEESTSESATRSRIADAGALLRLHADRTALAARQRRLSEGFAAAHPGVPIVGVPTLPTDVHDLPTLRAVGSHLGAVPKRDTTDG